jgi:hypothetical protein
MQIREFEFVPYEEMFNGRDDVLVAEKWLDEERGIRVFDDYSVCSGGENIKMYWIQRLIRKSDGTIQIEDVGYQLGDFFEGL